MPRSRRSDTPNPGRADKFRVKKVDASHIERPQPSHIERPDTPLPGRENGLLFRRPESPLFGRPENALFRRPENSLFGRTETSLFPKTGESSVGKAATPLSRGTEDRSPTGTPMIMRTPQKVKETQSALHGLKRPQDPLAHLRRNPRWKHLGPEPLTNPKDLPRGWNLNEPDLDPKDLEAQIKRCQERIEDNIMPHLFRARLKVYQERLKARQETSVEWPSHLSPTIKLRLDALHKIFRDIERYGDEFGDKKNVMAIMAAYLKGKLKWNVAKVTYWFEGKKLGKRRRYNPRYLRKLMKAHGNPKESGFWVEGATGPGSVNQLKNVMTFERHVPRVQFPDPDRLKHTGKEVQRRRCMYFEGKGPKSRLAHCETIEY